MVKGFRFRPSTLKPLNPKPFRVGTRQQAAKSGIGTLEMSSVQPRSLSERTKTKNNNRDNSDSNSIHSNSNNNKS